MMASGRAVLLWFVVSTVSGCGYHLRGTHSSGALGATHVSAPSSVTLLEPLRRALRQSGVQLVENRNDAELAVTLLSQKEQRRTLSFTDRARTAEYELGVVVRYRVDGRDSAELIAEVEVLASRTFRLNRDNLAATSQEESLLRTEIESDLVGQILRGLEAAERVRVTHGAAKGAS